ncbi:M24 family metallopeptidase [Conexibacter sp. CPCC 206217]|uniref:M24 family metallopeptidase n=1 Tax=Conexibacter sp. CPCC 206217 TaxID=3064574 RepID=UPI002715EC06|nr:M24 family metallopeptidase [Conexibacter sp. CPCC 206217]MDO8212678.1 M24 family metallopeptidase [Conexibacter sp. CPCC 206217]
MPIHTPGYMEGTRGSMATDWEGRGDVDRLRRQRTAKATEAVAQAGYDAVLLLSDPNIRYVTSVATSSVSGAGGFHYSLLTADGAITHWDSADHAVVQREACPWLRDIRYAAPGIGIVPTAIGGGSGVEMLRGAMTREVVSALRDHGITSGRVGVDVSQPALIAELQAAGYEVDAGAAAALAQARSTKTEDEIECLRMSAAICEAGFQAMKEMIKPGVRDNEIFAESVRRIIALGGEHGGGKLSSGPDTWPKSQADSSDRIIRPGDVVYADFYNIGYNGYRSCYYRTFSCGRAKQATHDAYKRAVENLYNVLDAMKPGATTADAAKHFPDSEGEYWDYYDANQAWQITTNHWGHGIGLQLYEIPLIWRGVSPEHPIELREGMTLAVETQDRDGSQGVRVEEMVVIRRDGVELLSNWPVWEITEVM